MLFRSLDQVSGRLSLSYPLLDATERIRGLIVASGGPEYLVRWDPFDSVGPRWSTVVDRLRRAIDSTPPRATRDGVLVRGPVRVVPYGGAGAYLQTAYSWHPDGTPSVRLIAMLLSDTVRTGSTIAAAAGLPAPALPNVPLSPAEFRARVDALYQEMRSAMSRGDWTAFGEAYETLGRLLQTPGAKP